MKGPEIKRKINSMPPLDSFRDKYWQWRARLESRMSLLMFRLAYRGKDCLCTVCGWQGGQFYPIGMGPDNKCPSCESVSRHRLLRLVLDDLEFPRKDSKVLHVSPKGEELLGKWFRARASWYMSIDKGGYWNTFAEGDAMKKMDLTDLQLPDESVDFICCNHVLENIVDDRKAIEEIYRVLTPGGVAALQVQIYEGETVRVETPTPEDYWHAWHPGRDYFQRFEQAGFRVKLYEKHSYDMKRYGFNNDVNVPICWKD
jgi:SAM-dependent methyltransferase